MTYFLPFAFITTGLCKHVWKCKYFYSSSDISDGTFVFITTDWWRCFPVWQHKCSLSSLTMINHLSIYLQACEDISLCGGIHVLPYNHCNCHWQVVLRYIDYLNLNNLILSCFIYLIHTCLPSLTIIAIADFLM